MGRDAVPEGVPISIRDQLPLGPDPTAIIGKRHGPGMVTLPLDMAVLMRWVSSSERVGAVKTRTQRSEQAFDRVNVPSLDWTFRDGRETVPHLGTTLMPDTVHDGPSWDTILGPHSGTPKKGVPGGPPGLSLIHISEPTRPY